MKKNETASSEPPDSGGENDKSTTREPTDNSKNNFKIGIYGWRKRCLYVLILVLLIMVMVNLTLTLWVLKVMEFSSEGMGILKIVTGGIRVEGRTFVLDNLIASSIKSRTGQPIVIESSINLTLSTRNRNGYVDNFLLIGENRFECLANNFRILDDRGILLFSADKHEILVGSESLRVSGEGGTTFTGSIQTSLVRAEPGHNLKLESPTRSLELLGPQGINIESRGGKIHATSLNDITLRSEIGSVHLEAGSVVMPALPTAIPSSKPSGSKTHEIFQLCLCENGKLFLAHPQHVCSAENDDVVCR